jgi:hypothetical protein
MTLCRSLIIVFCLLSFSCLSEASVRVENTAQLVVSQQDKTATSTNRKGPRSPKKRFVKRTICKKVKKITCTRCASSMRRCKSLLSSRHRLSHRKRAALSIKAQPISIELDHQGRYITKSGDHLSDIAKSSLLARGKTISDVESVYAEMARIALFNADRYPELIEQPRKPLPDKLQLRIRIFEKNTGVDLTDCGWAGSPWKEAVPNVVTIAGKCDRIEAGENTEVLAQPGSQVILRGGARAFGFPGAHLIALQDSSVITVGASVEVFPGSQIRALAPSEISHDSFLEDRRGP